MSLGLCAQQFQAVSEAARRSRAPTSYLLLTQTRSTHTTLTHLPASTPSSLANQKPQPNPSSLSKLSAQPCPRTSSHLSGPHPPRSAAHSPDLALPDAEGGFLGGIVLRFFEGAAEAAAGRSCWILDSQ
eukprot:3285658-Rhodomonas_salina.1